MTKRLIVNADDYGHTKGASEGIRRAHLNGIVSSTTVMMNRPAALTELECLKSECPKLGLGLHLVITTGNPVLPPSSIPTLVRQDGSFFKLDGFLEALDQIKINEVRAEWHAQVDLFEKISGHLPDHLDSHHHVTHFTPALLEETLLLAEEIGCPIRMPFNIGEPESRSFLPEMLAGQSLDEMAAMMDTFAPVRPQYFFDNFYGDDASRQTLLDDFDRIQASGKETFEIMCHPAMVDDDLMQASAYNTGRGNELEVLTTPGLREELSRRGIELITFGDL
jgi:predicted glycoside hydrolase/deacetylase ChbG (UPF0249 family)